MAEAIIRAAQGDMEQIRDTLHAAHDYHRLRDESNAALHLAPVRQSPLTNKLGASLAVLDELLGDAATRP